MKNVLITGFLLFLLSISPLGFSQELHLSFETGLGSYKMRDFKTLNDMDLRSLPFEAKITEDFPMFWYYKPSFLVAISKVFSTGIVWTYQSAGSRISREDYSGEYLFDTRIKASSPGLVLQMNYQVNKLEFSFFNEAGVEFSKIEMKEYLNVNAEIYNEVYNFKSLNFYEKPGLKISYPISDFTLGLICAYSIDFIRRPISLKGSGDISLSFPDDRQVTADWTGLRTGIFITYKLFTKSLSGDHSGQ